MTDSAASSTIAPTRLTLGAGQAAYDEAAARARDEHWARRVFDRDATLWSTNERVREAIGERLGWLDSPSHFSGQIAALEGFGEGIRDSGFTTTVVAGMGGSSLAPAVLHEVFGPLEDWLDLRVLDTTDPAGVSALVDDLDPLETLWIVATKSGTTTEPLAFWADFWDRAEKALRASHAKVYEHPGELAIAVTDPGRSLEAIPHHGDFRAVFLNPPDIGGRYSALSYVGLVPASLIGLDIDPLLESALAMVDACREEVPASNPGLSLGLAIGTLAKAGRDKLTLLADPAIAAFGSWLEQLLAESTGKHGTGIVPVDLEPIGDLSAYGDDRVFVRVALAPGDGDDGSAGAPIDAFADAAAAAGHPVILLELADPIDIGAEMFRWEFATAIAGAVLGIDPFDQPNVEEAKELTRKVLAGASDGEEPPAPAPPIAADEETGLTLHGDAPLRLTAGDSTVVGELARHLARRKANAYLCLQAFIAPSDAATASMGRIRALLRDATRCATTAGYGPRFLHSTGQLHKGGTPTGWFLQLTADHPTDRQIPGWPYTFGRLIDAQAEGDFAAIESHDLPILRVHLADPERGLTALEAALREAIGRG
jgi:glucose-6-phosphate isomerase/transaldolase/glucose-6-phosphate isomerase